MIDWLTFVIPCGHDSPIEAGRFQKIRGDGSVQWSTSLRRQVSGSWESAVSVRSASWVGDGTSHIEVSGNLVKFFQGHNLWGTDDLPALVVAFMRWLTLDFVDDKGNPLVSPSLDDAAAWKNGDYQLTRVDCTESFHLDNIGQVLEWLRAAEQTAHLAHRGRGQLVKGSTLYFGKNSRRWSLKLYSKGQEIRASGHGQESILALPRAVEWAEKTLRAEVTFRSMELKERSLDTGANWFAVDGVPFGASPELLRKCLGGMTMTTTSVLSPEVLDSLHSSQRVAYLAWLAGNDLRSSMPHRSFYRLRSKLLPHGVDIATVMPKEVSNVVPLHRVLEARPVSAPDWAMGTALFFEPRPLRVA